MLPVDQANALRDRHNGAFNRTTYLARIWSDRGQRDLLMRAIPLAELRSKPIEVLGSERGNRSGEGAPWTFIVRGEGRVSEIDRASPRGRITIDTQSGPVEVQVGSVVSGNAVRDAMPGVAFDDFPDQVAFAETGMALTELVMAPLRSTLAQLKSGDRVAFTGATSLSDAQAPLVVTPIKLSLEAAR